MLIQIPKNLKLIEKFLVWHSHKWVWPIWFWTLKLTVSQERTDGTNWFFACWYNFTQIKRWLKIFGVSVVKTGCGQSGHGTLKLTVFEEWTDGIYKVIFYMLIHDHQKLKADQEFFGWAWSKMGVTSLVTGLKNGEME